MHDTSQFTISERAHIERVLAAAVIHAPWSVPLWQAVRDGLLNVCQPDRTAQIPKKVLERSSRPLLILISDDDYASRGPAGWACGMRVRRWVKAGMLHAAGGKIEHYQSAVTGALVTGRFVLIETNSAQYKPWRAFPRPAMPTLSIVVRDGAHPIMMPGEAMN